MHGPPGSWLQQQSWRPVTPSATNADARLFSSCRRFPGHAREDLQVIAEGISFSATHHRSPLLDASRIVCCVPSGVHEDRTGRMEGPTLCPALACIGIATASVPAPVGTITRCTFPRLLHLEPSDGSSKSPPRLQDVAWSAPGQTVRLFPSSPSHVLVRR